jgi:hypothetical protein
MTSAVRQSTDDPAVIAEWRERVARCRASGMRVSEFAANEGVKPKQIAWWKGELTRMEKGLPRSRRSTATASPAFVALKVPAPTSSIDVVLRSGHSLRVSGDFDEQTLRRLIAALEDV